MVLLLLQHHTMLYVQYCRAVAVVLQAGWLFLTTDSMCQLAWASQHHAVSVYTSHLWCIKQKPPNSVYKFILHLRFDLNSCVTAALHNCCTNRGAHGGSASCRQVFSTQWHPAVAFIACCNILHRRRPFAVCTIAMCMAYAQTILHGQDAYLPQSFQVSCCSLCQQLAAQQHLQHRGHCD